MLSFQSVLISANPALTTRVFKPYKQLKPNTAIKINEVEYYSRTYTEQIPVEVGIYYGMAVGAALEADIHNQNLTFASTIIGRHDSWKLTERPVEPLLMNAEEITVYMMRSSETVESLVFKVWYEEIALSDTQLIQLNRNRGFSPFYALFK